MSFTHVIEEIGFEPIALSLSLSLSLGTSLWRHVLGFKVSVWSLDTMYVKLFALLRLFYCAIEFSQGRRLHIFTYSTCPHIRHDCHLHHWHYNHIYNHNNCNQGIIFTIIRELYLQSSELWSGNASVYTSGRQAVRLARLAGNSMGRYYDGQNDDDHDDLAQQWQPWYWLNL